MIRSTSGAAGKRFAKTGLLCAIALPAILAMAPAAAKTLVYCSEGSPENFYAGVNTTGTSFDVTEQIYSNIVEFERGGTKVIPNLATSWSISGGAVGGGRTSTTRWTMWTRPCWQHRGY